MRRLTVGESGWQGGRELGRKGAGDKEGEGEQREAPADNGRTGEILSRLTLRRA